MKNLALIGLLLLLLAPSVAEARTRLERVAYRQARTAIGTGMQLTAVACTRVECYVEAISRRDPDETCVAIASVRSRVPPRLRWETALCWSAFELATFERFENAPADGVRQVR